MSTSLYENFIAFGSTLYGQAADPADTVLMRDGVANNLLHIADSYAQMRVNYLGGFGVNTYHTFEPSVLGQWYPLITFGPWPLTLHQDGTPYVLRIRVAVSSSVATGTNTMGLRVVIAPDEDSALTDLHREYDSVFDVQWVPTGGGAIGTTPTWIDDNGSTRVARSRGSDFTSYLVCSSDQGIEWTQRVQVANAVSGGTPRSIEQCLVSAHVFTMSNSLSTEPRLHGLHIAEYVGL